MSRFGFLLAFIAALCFGSLVRADVPADEVTNIPGYGAPKSKQYSGFIPVDDAKTVFLHYWFVTSTGNPKTDPVTVWMNGGPGCSSLEGGLYELGPYTFTGKIANATGIPELVDNINAWTTVSSVLFLEQPAGVGFSYAVNGSTVTDDYVQSQNTYGFLLNWFKAFPEFASNEFFITGESYAGIYVPTLANRIVMGNAAGNAKINLQGIAVGNGCLGSEVGTCGGGADSTKYAIELFYGHAMVAEKVYTGILAECGVGFNASTDSCHNLISDALGNIGNIDVYNVYDTCNDGLQSASKTLRAPGSAIERLGDPVVCLKSDLGRLFMDDPTVRAAFHLEKSSVTSWSTCSDINYRSNLPDERPMYRTLVENIRVLIYNGDADSCVPWTDNYAWVQSMNYAVSDAWQPWMATSVLDPTRTWTGGFYTKYGANFTFLTVKHAGHMVPQYEPEAALTFYSRFLTNQ